MNVHPFVPQNILLMIASAGKVCVAIFVFASAYGITKQQEKSGDSNLAGRIIKIWMPFFFIYTVGGSVVPVSGGVPGSSTETGKPPTEKRGRVICILL